MKQQYEADEGSGLVPHLPDRSNVESYKYPPLLPLLFHNPHLKHSKPSI